MVSIIDVIKVEICSLLVNHSSGFPNATSHIGMRRGGKGLPLHFCAAVT
jgi:hypothetical protein